MIASLTTLPAMTNAELDALLDGLPEGTVEVDGNPGVIFEAALTERFSAHRGPFGDLPLEPSPAPSVVPMVVLG